MNSVSIRKYKARDRNAVRKISIKTAFLGRPASVFFSGDSVLADILTLYFTDYEPESCFVAEINSKVIGYIIGSKNVSRMKNVFCFKILLRVILKAFINGTILKFKNIRFFVYCIRSFLKGEFFVPDFSKLYPGTFHININGDFRGQDVGKKLMDHFLDYLTQNEVSGVHCATVNESAKGFFIRQGFGVLFKKKRTYWRKYLEENLSFYILGKKFK